CNGNTKTVKLLIENNANLNIRNNCGETALIWASGKGRTKIVKLLIENNANLDIQNKNCKTALMFGSVHFDIIKLLIELNQINDYMNFKITENKNKNTNIKLSNIDLFIY